MGGGVPTLAEGLRKSRTDDVASLKCAATFSRTSLQIQPHTDYVMLEEKCFHLSEG